MLVRMKEDNALLPELSCRVQAVMHEWIHGYLWKLDVVVVCILWL